MRGKDADLLGVWSKTLIQEGTDGREVRKGLWRTVVEKTPRLSCASHDSFDSSAFEHPWLSFLVHDCFSAFGQLLFTLFSWPFRLHSFNDHTDINRCHFFSLPPQYSCTILLDFLGALTDTSIPQLQKRKKKKKYQIFQTRLPPKKKACCWLLVHRLLCGFPVH